MKQGSLKDDLEKLRSEINQVADDDPAARERLNALISEIENRSDDASAEEDESLVNAIREEIASFETEHPRATAILNDIMVTLSNMGI